MVGRVAILVGGTPTLISEPTGPMTVVFTAVIMTLMAPDPAKGLPPDNGMAMGFTLVLLARCFQILFRVLKFGRHVTLIPYTVISGFMSGIGFILIIIQLPALLGVTSPSGGVQGSLEAVPGFALRANPVGSWPSAPPPWRSYS